MSPETKTFAVDTARAAVKRGDRLDAGIVVLFDLRHSEAFEVLVAVDPSTRDDPNGLESWKTRARGKNSLCAWLAVRETMETLYNFGMVDTETYKRVLGPPPTGEFRLALVGDTTLPTTMPLPN